MNPSKALLLALLLAVLPVHAAQAPGDVYTAKDSPELSVRLERYRQGLQGAGFRFDEDAGTLLRPDTKQPGTVAYVAALLAAWDKGNGWAAMERMTFQLVGKGRKLTDEELARVQLVANSGQIPKSVAEALTAKDMASKLVSAAAWNQYVAQTAYWDGQKAAEGSLGVKTAASGWERPPLSKAYFYDVEAALGAALQKDVEARLAKFAAGREALDHFRTPAGKLQLPAMLLLKQDSGNNATYDASMRAIVLNHRNVAAIFVAGLPDEKRAAAEASAKDPKKLAALLLADPKTRAAFVAANDDVLVHELTHAWQDKRGPFWSDMAAGKVPNVDPLECEQEAFLAQFRFIHEQLVSDPKDAVASPFFESYREMIRDLPAWRKKLTATYENLMPGAALAIEDVLKYQEMRKTASAQAALGSGGTLRTGMLRQVDLEKGSETIRREEAAFAVALSRFEAAEYPRLKTEAPGRMASAFLTCGDLARALEAAPPAKEKGDAGSSVEAGVVARTKTPARDEREAANRVAWISAVGARINANKTPWPDGFGDAYVKTYAAWAALQLKKAAGPPPDANALITAGEFVHALDAVDDQWKLSYAGALTLTAIRSEWSRRGAAVKRS